MALRSFSDDVRHALDRLIAARVAVVIVERLEVVDVDLEQRERLAERQPPGDFLVDRYVARETGQGAGRALLSTPLERVADTQGELASLPRLGEVVVGTAFESHDLVVEVGLGG